MVGPGLGRVLHMANGNLPPGPGPSKRRLWQAGRVRRESPSNNAPPQTGQICASAFECPEPLVGLRRSFIGILETPNFVQSSEVLAPLPHVFQGFYCGEAREGERGNIGGDSSGR